jgi:hypothetical protein
MNSFISYLEKNNFIPQLTSKPLDEVGIIIVIPCFNEPFLINTLNSLWNCTRPGYKVEIIIVVNHPLDTPQNIINQNKKSLQEAKSWIFEHPDNALQFHLIFISDMPIKHAGVGLARKIGMDEAVYRFNLLQNFKGIMVGFDADSLCDPNYLIEIENHFRKNPKTPGASIYFEHPIDDPKHHLLLNEGIILYELHLRVLNQGLRYAGHPHAFHTVGSSFAVLAGAYVMQGGMNKRQAGEDFYFIQKIIALGNYTEINSTRVIPSPRESDRVPFGTGAAIKKWIDSRGGTFTTYNPEAFLTLKKLFQLPKKFYTANKQEYASIISCLHPALIDFLEKNNYEDEISGIGKNTNSLVSFTNRFFNWFNVFKVIKFLNTSHNRYFEMMDVTNAAAMLLKNSAPDIVEVSDSKNMLLYYRNIERTGSQSTS